MTVAYLYIYILYSTFKIVVQGYTQIEEDESVNRTDSISEVTEPPTLKKEREQKILRESVVSCQTRMTEADFHQHGVI